jgi:hypothetical protein
MVEDNREQHIDIDRLGEHLINSSILKFHNLVRQSVPRDPNNQSSVAHASKISNRLLAIHFLDREEEGGREEE